MLGQTYQAFLYPVAGVPVAFYSGDQLLERRRIQEREKGIRLEARSNSLHPAESLFSFPPST
jgi:hypothetical protein